MSEYWPDCPDCGNGDILIFVSPDDTPTIKCSFCGTVFTEETELYQDVIDDIVDRVNKLKTGDVTND